jgi:hypothetical protein
MKWFHHDLDSRESDQIWELMEKHGLQGYGFWWVLLEECYSQEATGFQIEASETWFKKLSKKVNLTDWRTPVRMLDSMAELGLISPQLWADHIVDVPGIRARATKYVEKKAQNAIRQARFKEKNSRVSNALPNKNQVDSRVTNQKDPEVTLLEVEVRDQILEEESKKQEKGAKAPTYCELFHETFNSGKPTKWAKLVVMNPKRKAIARQLAKDCGSEKKAIEVLQGALRAANLNEWYQSKDLTFDNFASNGKIIQLYEKQVEATGDLGQQIAQDSIGVELDRLHMNGILPEQWGAEFGCSLVSELSASQAGRYLNWLRQQEVSHAA